ncbi:N-acetylmuramoyl-L-alanine amidase family protein [Larkinella sp. VNQ87]|uniref:N-acetylmuramoyl-L-alanine amidase family protein n=1 Tax=Larkinella sp. VNQ87 TaxID=3400921 RepID=UPI003BFCA995
MLSLVALPGMRPVLPQDNPKQDQAAAETRPGRLRTVVLDPGHGGKDPGTMTKRNRESRIVLKIALELGRRIKEELPDVKVIFTRSTDVFIELNERSAIANRNKADLFISIHVNASPSSSRVNGTETYTMGLHKTNGNLDVAKRENAVILKESNYRENYQGFDPDSPLAHIMLANYQHAFMNNSIDFAQKVEWSFRKNAERPSRGVKQAGFIVLWRTTMPSVLIETGYITNPDEERYLASEEGQHELANAIFRAFKAYKDEVDAEE